MNPPRKRNARFWAFINLSPVKITLKPDQELYWGWRRRSEEGWDAEYETWLLEDGVVTSTVDTDGCDCDGRLSTHQSFVCPVERLQDGHQPEEYPDVVYPAWEREEASQRDYAAEAAGY